MNGREVNIYNIDREANVQSVLIDAFLKNYGVNATVHAYSDQEKGIAAVNGLPNSIAFIGVYGNAIETYMGGKTWANYSIDESIRKIRENSPNAKVVVVTGGAFSKDDATKAGADAYLHKIDMLQNPCGDKGLVTIVNKLLEN